MSFKKIIKYVFSPNQIVFLQRFFKRISRPKFGSVGKKQRPVSTVFGLDRGTPIDRYYLNQFLQGKSKFISGTVAEIEENYLSLMHGGEGINSVVLRYGKAEGENQISCDLTNHSTLPFERFDTFICTQTLNFIYDFEKALEGIFLTLKPGGSLLLSVAGLCQISHYDMDRWGDYWRFTNLSIEKLLLKHFKKENIEITPYGNVLAAASFLYGIAAEEMKGNQLNFIDNNYQIIICVHAIKG